MLADGDHRLIDYRLILRPLPGSVLAVIRLRRVLKAFLRGYGFRCVSIEEVPRKAGIVKNHRKGLRRTRPEPSRRV